MDDHQFDNLTRALATGASRRALLKGLAGGSLAGAFAALRPRRGLAGEKIFICHLTGSETNPIVLIHVSVNAIPAHQAHGDAIDPDFQNDPAHCGGCFVSCDDRDPCTIDTCVEGVCVNTLIVCDDDSPCTDDACIEGECVFRPVPGGECDDGDACTEKDTCDATGRCVGTPVKCDDENACTTDGCDPARGCVQKLVDCDDHDACTVDNCDPDIGCIHESVNCNDNNACTIDSCDPAIGCVHSPIKCDDGDPCTSDSCDPDVGCIHEALDGACSEPCGHTFCTDPFTCCSKAGSDDATCCDPRTHFCCTVGDLPECCTSGQERCDPQAGGCKPFPPGP